MKYTEEFKRGMVRVLIASETSRKEFADKVDISVETLKRWIKQYKDEEVPKVDRKKYSEEYKKSIVKNMIYDGITCEAMARETGISRQLIEYWDNKYRYEVIDEVERETLQRKKVSKAITWHRYGSSAGRYE
ncbi:transposase [Anaerostipes sp. Marseille-Q3525]|uniref:transposase n=1 Tax=Anaerostipes sp. Marseille-Q3525 TaxID=2758418 RepID=UPI001BAB770B|nr:transposase [Anaerostipes sp. Marseille-Q3525]MBR9961247.1 transposase [Anaerostipes sp. Marseille-Q3525]